MNTCKNVAIVNGFVNFKKYNQFLCDKYKSYNYNPSVYKFNSLILFSSHLHPLIHKNIKEIVDKNDIIHCISGSSFVMMPYLHKLNANKKIILESPGVNFTTGTLLSSANLVTSYDIQENYIIKKFIDFFMDHDSWKIPYLKIMQEYSDKNKFLLLHSKKDIISDIRGHDNIFKNGIILEEGKHGQLFFKNDFNILLNYIKNI